MGSLNQGLGLGMGDFAVAPATGGDHVLQQLTIT